MCVSKLSLPDFAKDHIKSIKEVIVSSCKDLESLLLIGSAARGELSYKGDQVFSDYEFLAIAGLRCPHVLSRRRRLSKVKERLSELDLGQSNPLFHIDLTILHPSELSVLKRDMWTLGLHDSKVIYGNEGILDFIPRVGPNSADLSGFADLIPKRLHGVLTYAPRELIEGADMGEKASIFRYVLARNVLAIPLALLPLEGSFPASYREGFELMKEHPLLGEDLVDFLNLCLKEKSKPGSLKDDPREMYQRACRYFSLAAQRLSEFLRDFSFARKALCALKNPGLLSFTLRGRTKERLTRLMLGLNKTASTGNIYSEAFEFGLRTFPLDLEEWKTINEKVDNLVRDLYWISPSIDELNRRARSWSYGHD